MQRVIDEMAKAKGDVERELRKYIPEIIRECMAFAYLGKNFTFDVSDLSDRVNERLIALSDAILDDIESRAKKAIEYAEEEEDEDIILPYIRRQIGDEDLVQRLDKHCSTLRYFLEGWIAIGIVNNLKEYELTNTILSYIDNPLASPLWKDAFNAGYLSEAIRGGGYIYGKGNQKDVLSALTEIERYAINEAFQYGRVLKYGKMGAIGYRTYRASSYPCDYCDELTRQIWPLDIMVLPAHPRCVCFSTPVYGNALSSTDRENLVFSKKVQNAPHVNKSQKRIQLTEEQKAYRKNLSKRAMDVLRGKSVNNHLTINFSRSGIDEYLNQPHNYYFEKNEAVLVLDKMLEDAKYLGINPLYKKEGVKNSHIYEGSLMGNPIWFVVREYNDGRVFFHSCSDSSKIATGLIQKQP